MDHNISFYPIDHHILWYIMLMSLLTQHYVRLHTVVELSYTTWSCLVGSFGLLFRFLRCRLDYPTQETGEAWINWGTGDVRAKDPPTLKSVLCLGAINEETMHRCGEMYVPHKWVLRGIYSFLLDPSFTHRLLEVYQYGCIGLSDMGACVVNRWLPYSTNVTVRISLIQMIGSTIWTSNIESARQEDSSQNGI